MKFSNFSSEKKNLCILQGQVFIMHFVFVLCTHKQQLLRSCWSSQITYPHSSLASLSEAGYQNIGHISFNNNTSHAKRKPTFCICTAKLISAFIFATWIVQFLNFLNPKFPTSSHVLCLYSSVCVGPVQTPYCRFSYDADHILTI